MTKYEKLDTFQKNFFNFIDGSFADAPFLSRGDYKEVVEALYEKYCKPKNRSLNEYKK